MLPTPLSWVRKTLKILKSNLSPNQIAFSLALGAFAGLPPTGIHIAIPCTIALLVRCSFRGFLLSMGFFKLLSLAIAPASYAIGRWLLEDARALDPLWRRLAHWPVLAPMGYNRYLLLGSLVLALAVSLPTFYTARAVVRRYRERFTRWVAGWRVSERVRGRRGIGIVCWLLVGGAAKYETKRPPRGPFRYIRRAMLIGLPAVYGLCYLLAAFIVPFFAGTIATSTASWIVGTEVAVEGSSFSLFTGALTLEGFRVQDPNRPAENLLEIGELTLDAGLLRLLEKRVVFNRVVIAEAGLHVVREPDGTLNIDQAAESWKIEPYVLWAMEHAADVDWLGLIRRFIEGLGSARLPLRGDPYAPYRGGRSLPPFSPPFVIDRLEIGRLHLTLRDDRPVRTTGPLPRVTLIEIEVQNLALPADLRSGAVELRLRGRFDDVEDAGFELSARYTSEGGIPVATYAASITRVDLPAWAAFYETTLPIEIESGRATLRAEIVFRNGQADGAVSLLLEELILGASSRLLFGLPPETSQRVIDGINRYAQEVPIVIGFGVGGTSADLAFDWEAPLLAVARDGLLIAGQRQFADTIEELGLRVDALGGVADMPLDPNYEALREGIDASAGRLIESVTESVFPFLPLVPRADEPPSSQDPVPWDELLRRIQRTQTPNE